MIKKTIYALCFSTISLMALDTGDTLSMDMQRELNLENNKTYVIDFFASWCKSCKKELPLISKVYNEHIVEVVGVNVDKKKEDAEAFVKELNLPFKVIYDTDKKFIEAFNPIGFPSLYYIKDGKIVKSIMGAVDAVDEQIAKDIEEIK
jgi:thiol-disulfide isomerase/thioredoxin